MNSQSKSNAKVFAVFVDDNFHPLDETERYENGEYIDCKAATAACKEIVDESLLRLYELNYREDMTAEQLYHIYTGMGEDPFIVSGDKTCQFSAWDYAKTQCEEVIKVKKAFRKS